MARPRLFFPAVRDAFRSSPRLCGCDNSCCAHTAPTPDDTHARAVQTRLATHRSGSRWPKLVYLPGNTRPHARAINGGGRVSADVGSSGFGFSAFSSEGAKLMCFAVLRFGINTLDIGASHPREQREALEEI